MSNILGGCGSKSSFHFLLHTHAISIPSGKENEIKEKGAGHQAHYPLKTHCQPLWAAYPQASNVPDCSWTSSLLMPLEFSMMPYLRS